MPSFLRESSPRNLESYIRISEPPSPNPKKRPAPTSDENEHKVKKARTIPANNNGYINLVTDLRRGGFTADQRKMLASKLLPPWRYGKNEETLMWLRGIAMVTEQGRCDVYKREEEKVVVLDVEEDVIMVDEDDADDDVSQYVANFRKFCKEMEEIAEERARATVGGR